MLIYHPTPTGRYPTSDMVSSVDSGILLHLFLSSQICLSKMLGIRRYDRYHVKA